MSWEVTLGIVIFTSVYVLLKSADLMSPDESNPAQEALVNGLKIYLIIIAMLLSFLALAATPDVIELSLNETASNPDGDTFKSVVTDDMGIMSKAYMMTLIPFVFFMLILLVIFVFTYFTEKKPKRMM